MPEREWEPNAAQSVQMRTYLIVLGMRVHDVDNDVEAGLLRRLDRARISQTQRGEEFAPLASPPH